MFNLPCTISHLPTSFMLKCEENDNSMQSFIIWRELFPARSQISERRLYNYIVACQAHPALIKICPVFVPFLFLVARQPVYMYQVTVCQYIVPCLWHKRFSRTKGLTDRVSSWLRGLTVYWRPRPSGRRQYVSDFDILHAICQQQVRDFVLACHCLYM